MIEKDDELLYEEDINTINGIWKKRTYKSGRIQIRRYSKKHKMWISVNFKEELEAISVDEVPEK